jgi:ribosomal protein L29
MEFKELKKKTAKELQIALGETREKLRDLRFRDASKQLKNVREIRDTKKNIARILMLLKTTKEEEGKSSEAVK